MYLYPKYFTDELIDVIAGEQENSSRISTFRLQHINDTMLRRMQRRVNRVDTEALLDRLRGAHSRTRAADHVHHRLSGRNRRTIRGSARVCPASSDSSGWACSPIRSSPTRRPPGSKAICTEEVKESRREALMEVQQEVAFAWNEAQVGRQFDVLLDWPAPDEPNVWLGRTYADAPDIDSVVYVTGKKLKAGQIVPCEIVATSDYDLVAAPVGDPR